MEMKDIGPRGGASLAPPPDPPMLIKTQTVNLFLVYQASKQET